MMGAGSLTRLKKGNPHTDGVGMRVLCIALIALMASGCFVSDELDKGNEILDQQISGKKAKMGVARQEAPSEPADEPGLWDSLVGWFEEEPDPAKARAQRKEPGLWDSLVGWVEEELEPEPPPPDPEDAPVRCRIGKREHFSSLRDCQARGGKPVSLDPVQ